MSQPRTIIRVILYVQDMNRMVQFYRDLLNVPVLGPQLDDYADQFWVELASGACRVTLHGGGQRRLGADTPKLAFRSHDIQADRERLLAAGVKIGDVRSPAPGVQVCDGFDPEGHPFSLDAYEEPG